MLSQKSNVFADSVQDFYVNLDKVEYLEAVDSSFHSYTFLVNRLNQLTNHPDVKPEMEALEAYVDGNPVNEDGVELQLESDGSYTSVPPVSTGNGFTSFATASANTVVQIHAHGVGDYDYPSDGDLVLLSEFLNQVKEANTNSNGIVLNNGQNITAIMISDGKIVALRIGNLSQLENLYDRIFNQNLHDFFLRAYNSRVIEPIDEECFAGTNQLCADLILEEKYKNNFDKFLDDVNLGIDLFTATKDSDGNYVWNCVD